MHRILYGHKPRWGEWSSVDVFGRRNGVLMVKKCMECYRIKTKVLR